MTSSPLSRAEQARKALTAGLESWGGEVWASDYEALDELIPEGALILTREETEQVRHELEQRIVQLGWSLDFSDPVRVANREALALLSAGQPEQENK